MMQAFWWVLSSTKLFIEIFFNLEILTKIYRFKNRFRNRFRAIYRLEEGRNRWKNKSIEEEEGKSEVIEIVKFVTEKLSEREHAREGLQAVDL